MPIPLDSTNSRPVDPQQGISFNLANVDRLIKTIEGRQPIDVTMAHMSVAQVFATCALTHAVRELTETIRSHQAQS